MNDTTEATESTMFARAQYIADCQAYRIDPDEVVLRALDARLALEDARVARRGATPSMFAPRPLPADVEARYTAAKTVEAAALAAYRAAYIALREVCSQELTGSLYDGEDA